MLKNAGVHYWSRNYLYIQSNDWLKTSRARPSLDGKKYGSWARSGHWKKAPTA